MANLGRKDGIFSEGDIHLPVQPVFDVPVMPQRSTIVAGLSALAADEVADLRRRLALHGAFVVAHADDFQPRPLGFRALGRWTNGVGA